MSEYTGPDRRDPDNASLRAVREEFANTMTSSIRLSSARFTMRARERMMFAEMAKDPAAREHHLKKARAYMSDAITNDRNSRDSA